MANLSTLESLGIAVGVASGIGGLVLGVLNTISQRAQSRPRVLVRPSVKRLVGEGHDGTLDDLGLEVWIEIHNVGLVPVTTAQTGFEGRRNWFFRWGKHVISFITRDPSPVDGGSWPRRLGPWESVVVRFSFENTAELGVNPQFKFGRRAFVQSQVGDTFVCSRRDMGRFLKAVRNAKNSGAESTKGASENGG
jgi:hypothetical protein